MPNSGILFIGTQGKLLTDYSGGKPLLLPEVKFRDFAPPAPVLERSKGHYREWVQAIKTGSPTHCPFSLGGAWRKWRCWARLRRGQRDTSSGIRRRETSPTTRKRSRG